jgi:hypothetical protein
MPIYPLRQLRSRVASSPDIFPVIPDVTGRFLVNRQGAPFPVLCRACWIIFNISPSAYGFVFSDTVAKGFNAIEMKAPITGSQDLSGNWPFSKRLDGATWTGQFQGFSNINTEAPDFTTPVDAYWANVDAFFNAALGSNLLVFFFPAYVGYPDTDWWMHCMAANGQTKMQTYGAYIANRYRNQKNLVWMLGGDDGTSPNTFASDETASMQGLIDGLKSVTTTSAQYGTEWTFGSIGKDLFPSSVTLNSCYSLALDVCNQGSRGYSYSPATPAYFQELPFEEDVSTPPPNRQYSWWGWLTTIGGYTFGNGTFTSFVDPTYLSHMNTQGTLDAQRLNAFIRTIPWQTLVPNNAAITAGGGTINTADQVVAAVNPLGTLLLAYVPTSHTGTVTIDMTKMGGSTTARWYDPTNATYTAITSGLSNTGTHAFTLPGTNSAGDLDWVLRLDA